MEKKITSFISDIDFVSGHKMQCYQNSRDLGLDTVKPVFRVRKQVKFNPVHSATEM